MVDTFKPSIGYAVYETRCKLFSAVAARIALEPQ